MSRFEITDEPMGILVVESGQNQSRSSYDILASQGWQVQRASGADECIASIRTQSFNVAVLELPISGNADLELLQQIRIQAPTTQVIAVTCDTAPAALRHLFDAGAFECLTTPISPQQFQNALESALRAHSPLLEHKPKNVSGAGSDGVHTLRVNPELCWGCLACTVACAYSNLRLPEDAPLRPEVLAAARISIEGTARYAVPLVCMQCSDAACVSVCPSRALHRPDPCSPITADSSLCIGCGRCVLACSLGVLTINNRSHVVQKCDMCIGRTQAGNAPACVEACPKDALEFVKVDMETSGGSSVYWRKSPAQMAAPPMRLASATREPVVTEDVRVSVHSAVQRYSGSPGFLIPILQDIQKELGYLPPEALKEVSHELGTPLSRVYNVATFYTSFSLNPRGRHIISVCTGTVCHLKGAGKLAEAISNQLQIAAGGTTDDLRFTLETVNCLGACALAPVVVIDGNYYAKVEPSGLAKLLKAYE